MNKKTLEKEMFQHLQDLEDTVISEAMVVCATPQNLKLKTLIAMIFQHTPNGTSTQTHREGKPCSMAGKPVLGKEPATSKRRQRDWVEGGARCTARNETVGLVGSRNQWLCISWL